MADRRPPLSRDGERRVVVLEAGSRSIVGRVLFFGFLGLLVLALALGQGVALFARERRVAAASGPEGEDFWLLTARRGAPEMSEGYEEESPVRSGEWRLVGPEGKKHEGLGFPRAIQRRDLQSRILFDDHILVLSDEDDEGESARRESFGGDGYRALGMAGADILVRDLDNNRLALLESAPGGLRRRDVERLGGGKERSFVVAGLRRDGDIPVVAWVVREEGEKWLEVRRCPSGREGVTVSRRRLSVENLAGIQGFTRGDLRGWLLFSKGDQSTARLQFWEDEGDRPRAETTVEVGLPVYGGALVGADLQGAVFGAGTELVIVEPGHGGRGPDDALISVKRQSNRLDAPWWGLGLRAAIFLAVLTALAFGVLRAIMRSKALIFAGAKPGALPMRVAAFTVDFVLAEIIGALAALLVGAGWAYDRGLLAVSSIMGGTGQPGQSVADLDGQVVFRVAVSLFALIVFGAFAERRFGRTPGKWLFDLEVIGRSGRPGWGEALQRRVVLLLDLFLFAGVYALINPAHQRVGDVAADTVVITSPKNQATFVSVLMGTQDGGTTGSKEKDAAED